VPDEVLPAGVRQLVNGALEAEAGELLRLTGSRTEARTPEQALGLRGSEMPSPYLNSRHVREHRQRAARTGSLIEGR
jgi:hypothetical protein